MPLKNLPKGKHDEGWASYTGLVYARVSSKKQETEGSGLQSQEGRCIADLKAIGVPYKKSFLDSFSGGGDFMNRPAMRALIAYIDANPQKKFLVVFDDIKRFARDVEFHLKLRAAFKVRNVRLRCLNYNFEEDSDEGDFAEIIFAAQAELERKQNRRQVIQKQKARLESGHWAFVPKKGYRMIKDATHGKLSVLCEDSKAIKFALEAFANGTFARKIDACNYLVKEGVWKGRPEKHLDHFSAMLKDPFYAGYIEYPQWEVARRPGFHEPLISLETFERNQKRLSGKSATSRIRRDINPDFPLRGLVVCDHCGKHLTGYWSKKHTYAYYGCQNKQCARYMKAIRKDDIEVRFSKMLKQYRLKDEVAKVVEVVFDGVWREEVEGLKKDQAQAQNRTRELRELAEQLTQKMLKAKPSLQPLYEEQLEKIAADIQDARGGYEQKIDFEVPYRTALSKAVGLLKNPYAVWVNLPTMEQQRLFFFIFEEKLRYHEIEGYRTGNNPGFMGLFEQFTAPNTVDVDLRRIELLPPPCHGDVIPFYYRPNILLCESPPTFPMYIGM